MDNEQGEIDAVSLQRDGDYVVVMIEEDGEWREVGRERFGGLFCQILREGVEIPMQIAAAVRFETRRRQDG